MPKLTPAEEAARDREYQRQHYLANREQILARHKARRGTPEGKAEMAERGRRYYEAHREQVLARCKAYHADPAIKAMRAEYAKRRAEDPNVRAMLNAAYQRYCANYPERIREACRRWELRNQDRRPQLGRTARARLYARRYGLSYEDISFAEIVRRDQGICRICGRPVDLQIKFPNPLSATWDHIVPFSRGGAHTYDNVQLAHFGCNAGKGNRLSTAAVR